MARRQLPRPTRRKGALTWEVRARINGKIISRSLRARDYKLALKRLPRVYDELLRQFEAVVVSSDDPPKKTVPASDSFLAVAQSSFGRTLTIPDVCQRYREHLLTCEQGFRRETAQAGVTNAIRLAGQYRERLHENLRTTHAKSIVHDFANQEWFLTYLSNSGQGNVRDRGEALAALARTGVATIREILTNDFVLPDDVGAPGKVKAASTPPTLSEVLEQYITERGLSMTAEVAAGHRAVVRDFCALTDDKPVNNYGREDARRFKEILLCLPANWRKSRDLRGSSIVDAARKAKSLGLHRQRAKSIQLKRASLRSLFSYAAANYDGVYNPFEDKAAWVVADSAASDQRDAFSEAELKTLLGSELPKELYWLTWLGLCTGARLNELCQLTTDHISHTWPEHIHFSPELRLKTGALKSCVRKVPLHPTLLSLGFLSYVSNCENNVGKKLFPDLPKHRTGRFSDAPSKAFSRHLKKLGIKRSKLSFHSLRHSFAAEFKRNAPRDVEARERLMGHHVPGVAGRYGGSYEAETADPTVLRNYSQIVRLLQF